MADSTVINALAWLLLAAFLGGLTVAVTPYVHAAWTQQTAAVAERLRVLAALPLGPRPAREPRVPVLASLLPASGAHRREAA